MSGPAPEPSAELHAYVHAGHEGRVQGVYFREFTRRHAIVLGLGGWVRNLSDGTTVEVVAHGPRAALEALLGHLRQGPPGASVASVDASMGPVGGPPGDRVAGFTVRD